MYRRRRRREKLRGLGNFFNVDRTRYIGRWRIRNRLKVEGRGDFNSGGGIDHGRSDSTELGERTRVIQLGTGVWIICSCRRLCGLYCGNEPISKRTGSLSQLQVRRGMGLQKRIINGGGFDMYIIFICVYVCNDNIGIWVFPIWIIVCIYRVFYNTWNRRSNRS